MVMAAIRKMAKYRSDRDQLVSEYLNGVLPDVLFAIIAAYGVRPPSAPDGDNYEPDCDSSDDESNTINAPSSLLYLLSLSLHRFRFRVTSVPPPIFHLLHSNAFSNPYTWF